MNKFLLTVKKWQNISAYLQILILMFLSSTTAVVTTKILKYIVGRAGPKYWLEHLNTSYLSLDIHGFQTLIDYQDFPSGHSAVIGVLIRGISSLNIIGKNLFYLIFGIVILFLVLNLDHYLSDCLVGMMLGYWVMLKMEE